MPVELPNISPDISPNEEVTMGVLRADFGDNYAQRAREGLNSVRSEWLVAWSNRQKFLIDQLYDFLKARGGSEAFSWTPPGETVAKIWTCDEFTRFPAASSELWSLSATFTEEFDLNA